jgi:DNA-binding CsgD family transcriptional regulator
VTILMQDRKGERATAALFDDEVEERASELLARMRELREPPDSGGPRPVGFEQVCDAVEDAFTVMMEQLHDAATSGRRAHVASLADLVFELHALQGKLREQRLNRRLRALIRVQEALSRLRGIDSVEKLIQQAGVEACRACDLDRAMVFRVDGSRLIVECTYIETDPEWAARITSLGRQHPPPLEHGLLETEMLRRRSPALVLDPANDPRAFQPLVMATATRAYVAAPIMPEGRVIGFVHADRHFREPEVDTFDRDTLWAFAEGLGYAIERTVLLERLRSQRDQVRRMVASTEAVLSELSDAEVQFGRAEDRESIAVARTAAAMFVAPESRIEALLTRREREVLALMASGATNGEIANRLVISEGTVKSHVKHILRKLRASNRAEAVSRYMRLATARRAE